jgi:UDP-glucose 4-epimerase
MASTALRDIADVAPVITRLVDVSATHNQVFNVGADTPYSVSHLAKVVMEAMDIHLALNHLPARNAVVHTNSDHSRAQRVFGTPSLFTLEEGITRMASGPRHSCYLDEIEIAQNLPSSWVQTERGNCA